MNALIALFRGIQLEYLRWRNRRARARRIVWTWENPIADSRDWQRHWEEQERPAILRRQAW